MLIKVAHDQGNLKATAQTILGSPQASLLTQKCRDTLWRISTKLDPINAADGHALNRIIEKMQARAA